MDFNELVEYYEKIGATSKRLEITEILAELLTQCKKVENRDDLPKIIYLTQGRLVSEIDDWPKFGMAEKSIIQALVRFTRVDSVTIKAMINKFGDVGEATQELLKKKKSRKSNHSRYTNKKNTGS